MARVYFHRLAERELNDAALYYGRESTGLGVSFLDEIERYLEAILRKSERWPQGSWAGPAPHPSQVPIRNPLLRKA